MTIDLEGMRAAAEKADAALGLPLMLEGNWLSLDMGGGCGAGPIYDLYEVVCGPEGLGDTMGEHFVASQPRTVLALLDYVERLKAERDEAVSMMSRMCGDA